MAEELGRYLKLKFSIASWKNPCIFVPQRLRILVRAFFSLEKKLVVDAIPSILINVFYFVFSLKVVIMYMTHDS